MSEIRNLESIFVPTLDPTHFVWPIHILLVWFCLFIFSLFITQFYIICQGYETFQSWWPTSLFMSRRTNKIPTEVKASELFKCLL